MQGHEDEPVGRRFGPRRPVQGAAQHVVGDVADRCNERVRVLPPQLRRHAFTGSEQRFRHGAHRSPVDLLGHQPVGGVHASLHVGHRHARLGGSQGAGEGRIGIPDDDGGTRPVGGEPVLTGDQDGGGLARVGVRPDTEIGIGRSHAQLVVVHLVEVVVVMLAGIDGDHRPHRGQRVAQHARLDHLRPRAEEQGEGGETAHR
ncbi:MAG: hypothetical protein AUH78_09795 [Gemmatimonadetes bacterium 13_1_40CM_4_69_8]|nr:MAG: hypothetical protein AUH78_09795 [Gemmatimonadetes bacterium 13_1_40CM_4_69_8]